MFIPDFPALPGMAKLAAILAKLLSMAASAGLPLPCYVVLSDNDNIWLQFPPGTDSVNAIRSWESAFSAMLHGDRNQGDGGPGISAVVNFIFHNA